MNRSKPLFFLLHYYGFHYYNCNLPPRQRSITSERYYGTYLEDLVRTMDNPTIIGELLWELSRSQYWSLTKTPLYTITSS